MKLRNWVLAGAALISLSGSALADTIYVSQSAFNTAVSGATTYTFPAVNGFQDEGTGYTLGPLTFSAGSITLFANNSYGNGEYLGLNAVEPITMVTATNAIAFTVGAYSGAETVEVYINGIPVDLLSVAKHPNSTFFGYVSDTPITSVAFQQSTNTEFDILNVATGAPSPAPEPSSLALLGSALIGGAATLRKRLFRA
ncbi:MAG TPA: PEP-CTERM sorting domain-containing protein [Acidobacteriaceae bacterium]|nr:PEP-CTERM sorting domain-containing protein [Acidobacteriaceae bacterium]